MVVNDEPGSERLMRRRKSSLHEPSETCGCCRFSDKVTAYKNLVGVCVSFICSFGAFIGLVYLQSSLNVDSGLGLISSALTYGSKYSIILGYVLILSYTVANYYPRPYTLYPAGILAGMGLSLMFGNTHIQNSTIASKHAAALKERDEDAIALFAGVFGMAIKLAQVFGSLVSSATLINVNDGNDTSSMAMSNESCTNTEASHVEQDDIYYVLVSIYLFMGIVGIAVGTFTIDHCGTEASYLTASLIVKRYIVDTTVKTFKLMFHWKMLLLLPLFVLNGLTLGFAIGTFSKFYVSDCVGIAWIGFVTIVNSIASAIAGVIMGRLYKYIPSIVIIHVGVAIEIGLSLFLIFWERSPNLYAVFGFVIGWGICDAVWNAFLAGVVGAMFVSEKEIALQVFITIIALGFSISFIIALFLSTINQLWVIFGIVVISGITYTALAIGLKLTEEKSSYNTTVKDSNSSDIEKDDRL